MPREIDQMKLYREQRVSNAWRGLISSAAGIRPID
jgi:hypothetical protein